MGSNTLSTFLIIAYILLNGCSSTKHVQQGEYLVIKNKIDIPKKGNIKLDKELKQDLLEIANPKPNTGYLKIPLRIYGFTKERKEKGFKNFLFKKYAEEPSIYNSSKVQTSILKMDKYLLDHGYIGSKVSADTTLKNNKIEIQYKVNAKKRHKIKSVTHIRDTTAVGHLLKEFEKYSLIKTGDYYSKSNIDDERRRLAVSLKNKGYLDISEKNFYFTIDTQSIENVVDISILYKLPGDQINTPQYRLGTTYIHTLSESAKVKGVAPDTMAIKPGMFSVQHYEVLRPKILDFSVNQDSSENISFERQQLTVNHFISYGLYRFVNQKYSEPYGDSLNIVDRNIYLTPGSDGSIGLDFELNNRSGNFFGTAITGSYSNNNTFKGAEVFSIGLTLGSEVQVDNQQSLLNTLIVDFNLGLDIPRLLIPYFYNRPSKFYIPHTKLNFSNLFESRLESYVAIRSSFVYAYQWRENKRSNHLLSPLSISYLNLLSTTTLFDESVEDDLRLQISLQDILDVGLEYTYTYTDQNPKKIKNYSYLTAYTRLAGNLLNVVVSDKNMGEPKLLFDTPFAQYSKFAFDYRYYIPYRKSKLISRVHAGVAYAYGNSNEVPYNEQFTVGGAQSMRGFDFRGLGPGSFVLVENPDNSVQNQFFDQTGDVLLEMNLEYRFPMAGFLKGAVFIDAGNVWLINDNPSKPGGVFRLDSFVSQIGVNTGYGFRFDFDFLVLRFDMGFVLRRPYLDISDQPEGFDWTTRRVDAFTGPWVKENLNFQIGIGYPF